MRRLVITTLMLAASGLAAITAAAGELRFVKTAEFKLDEKIVIDGTVGPVAVESVEFSDRGSGATLGSKVLGRIRGSGSTTQTTLRAAFVVENPRAEDWEVTFTMELLDSDGKLIDRASRTEDFEGEATTYNLDHVTLAYVVPLIHSVRITLEAELD